MLHNGTFYGIEIWTDGYRVTVGMTVVCDGISTYREAVEWIESQ